VVRSASSVVTDAVSAMSTRVSAPALTVTLRVLRANPMRRAVTCTDPGAMPESVYSPFDDVTAPCVRPVTETVAAGIGWPFPASVTRPRIVPVLWATSDRGEQRKTPIIAMRILVFIRMYRIVVDAGAGLRPAWSGRGRYGRETVRESGSQPSSLIVARSRLVLRAPATRSSPAAASEQRCSVKEVPRRTPTRHSMSAGRTAPTGGL